VRVLAVVSIAVPSVGRLINAKRLNLRLRLHLLLLK